MLNMAKVQLELISDPDMYIFFEIHTSGGVSYISNRCSKASILHGYAMFNFFQQPVSNV